MTFRKPLLAAPIILGALLVLMIAGAPAKAAGEMVTLEITHVGAIGEVVCSVENGPEEPCKPEYEAGTKIRLHAKPGGGVTFVGFSEGKDSAEKCTGPADCEFTLVEESSVEADLRSAGETGNQRARRRESRMRRSRDRKHRTLQPANIRWARN